MPGWSFDEVVQAFGPHRVGRDRLVRWVLFGFPRDHLPRSNPPKPLERARCERRACVITKRPAAPTPARNDSDLKCRVVGIVSATSSAIRPVDRGRLRTRKFEQRVIGLTTNRRCRGCGSVLPRSAAPARWPPGTPASDPQCRDVLRVGPEREETVLVGRRGGRAAASIWSPPASECGTSLKLFGTRSELFLANGARVTGQKPRHVPQAGPFA